jgi:hypothetical protein
MFINIFGSLAASAQVYTFRAMQYIWVKNDLFTIYGLGVSKDAEFYVNFKNINLYKWQNAPKTSKSRIKIGFRGGPLCVVKQICILELKGQ